MCVGGTIRPTLPRVRCCVTCSLQRGVAVAVRGLGGGGTAGGGPAPQLGEETSLRVWEENWGSVLAYLFSDVPARDSTDTFFNMQARGERSSEFVWKDLEMLE